MSDREEAILFHQVEGEGEPLLLLNGVFMTGASWQPVAQPLAENFRLVRCDFRGQLMMPVPPPNDLEGHADDVVALLDHLKIESAHIVGTSLGGVVGAIAAARHSDRVRSLTTIASADGFHSHRAEELNRWKAACRRTLDGGDRGELSDVIEPVVFSPEWVEAHRDDRAERRAQIAALPDIWFETAIGLLDGAHSVHLRDELAAIGCPTLVVAAELDGFVSVAEVRDMADRIEGARFEIIEGAGHAVVVEQPQRVTDLCLEFLGSVTHEEENR
ncbi:MAG: alpha/beta fold hydrolase [Acidobacteriota bacterium]